MSENFLLVGKVGPKMINVGLKTPILVKFRGKTKIVSTRNVHCRKIATSYPTYTFQPTTRLVNTTASGRGLCPLPEKFLNFYIKMVSSGAFWVAISYRLAACFTGIGSTCEVEIYWRSFRRLGTIITPWGKLWAKMTKMGNKLIKIAQKSRRFCTFSVFVLLKFHLAGSRGGGARAPVPLSQCSRI